MPRTAETLTLPEPVVRELVASVEDCFDPGCPHYKPSLDELRRLELALEDLKNAEALNR